MKTRTIQSTCALLAIGFLMACEGTEDLLNIQSRKVIVEFAVPELSIVENERHYDIRMPFDKTAAKGGLITLSAPDFDASRLKVEPALEDDRIELVVEENSQFAVLRLTPIDNSSADGDLSFNISITETCPNFTIGGRATISITLTDDDSPSIATLMIADGTLTEKNTAGKAITVALSRPLASPGSILIAVSSAKAVYGTHYTTEPPATGGVIILNCPVLATSETFTILPVDNSILSGHLDLAVALDAVTGSIIKGPEPAQGVHIIDDELAGMPRSYSIGAGQWGLRKTLEYDQSGRIQYVHFEKSTPATSTHTETYFYHAHGRISRINLYPQIDEVFTWTSDRITRSENIDHGVIKDYTEYDYDAGGNVSGAASFFRQPDGTFRLGFLNTYLYFSDGNLYKQQTYIAGNEPGEYTLLSTRMFDDYIDAENPFPMVDILPNARTQKQLPGRYTLEEHGMILDYVLTYEYTLEGLVKKRTARSGVNSEVALYDYY